MNNETKNPDSKELPPEAEEPEISLEQLDSLLAEEDPSFANEFAAIKIEKFETDIGIEDFDSVDPVISDGPSVSPTGRSSRVIEFLNTRKQNLTLAVKGIIPFVIGVIAGFFKTIFASIKSFFKMPLKQKGVVVLVVGLSALLVVLVLRGLGESVLPNFELKFLTSFDKVADRSFKVEAGESFEDFDNPLRHPDFVVLIERLVVNLKSGEANDSPMGMFEFYIEASSQEGAIEINERQKEVRDMMARNLEVATHADLASSTGKDKMKLTLRRELNTLLTQGRVRRVFFKTIILKP